MSLQFLRNTSGKVDAFYVLHLLIHVGLLTLAGGTGSTRLIILFSGIGHTFLFNQMWKRRWPWWMAVGTYLVGVYIVIWSNVRLDSMHQSDPLVRIPGFAPPDNDIPLTTSGDFSIIVGPYGATLSPYRNVIEASLMNGAVRSALGSFEPYVTGDDISIVIPCRNEDQYIIKTIQFTIENTPNILLREIILIDDASDVPLESLVNGQLTPTYRAKVRVHRFETKQGLIRARIHGAEMATSDNIFFLDGHCRPRPGWLPPLLQHLKANYKRIACPIIEDIHQSTWLPLGTSGVKMMFHWNFEFFWYEDMNNEIPLAPGGILALTKKWFMENGQYDPGMREWGGENLEQSFRVWLTGGEIYAVKKSKIGHIFARPPKDNPNNQLVIQVQKNQKRAAKVWLDDYYKYFERFHVEARNLNEGADISERVELRKHLKSLPFKWYATKFRTSFERNALLADEYLPLMHKESGLCMDATNEKNESNHRVLLVPCATHIRTQLWMNVAGGRMIANYETKMCLTSQESDANLVLQNCEWNDLFTGKKNDQLWILDTARTYHIISADIPHNTQTGNDPIFFDLNLGQSSSSWCLTAMVSNTTTPTIIREQCKPVPENSADSQGFIWLEIGKKAYFVVEPNHSITNSSVPPLLGQGEEWE